MFKLKYCKSNKNRNNINIKSWNIDVNSYIFICNKQKISGSRIHLNY